MKFVEEHFEKLRAIAAPEESWAGHKIRPFARSVLSDYNWVEFEDSLSLPDDVVKREYLTAFMRCPKNSNLACALSFLAWGGMNRKHGELLFRNWAVWIPIVDGLRTGKCDRNNAYSKFAKLRSEGKLPGMGPAYFTKLIYFLTQSAEQRGYIMDQWTARSTNLLLGSDVVRMIKAPSYQRVSDSNTAEIYGKFCQFIEILAHKLDVNPPDLAEMRIFSEGRGKGEWKNYVRAFS